MSPFFMLIYDEALSFVALVTDCGLPIIDLKIFVNSGKHFIKDHAMIGFT